MTVLETKDLKKYYGSGDTQVKALDGVDLTVENGEFVAIVGTSGSGKSTLLHMLGGLDRPTGGSVLVEGRDIFALKDEELTIFRRRKIGFVFQSYNLVPVLSVYDNIVLPIQLDGGRVDETYVDQVIEALGLEQMLDRLPNQLSGGQQQRVAFARAIAVQPGCILFDEPLSALDALLREEMRHELSELTSALGITSVFVTHDQTEAMSMSDRIAVLNGGRVEQYAAPETIYHAPATEFVARFVGKSNWLNDTEMFHPEAAVQTPMQGALHFELPVQSVQYLGNTYEITVPYQAVTWTLHSGRRVKPGEMLSFYVDSNQVIHFQKKEGLSA